MLVLILPLFILTRNAGVFYLQIVNNILREYLFIKNIRCKFVSLITHKTLRRLHIFIEQEWFDKLKRDAKSHGFTTVSSFVRYIIIKFFEK